MSIAYKRKLLSIDPALKFTVLVYQQNEDYDFIKEYFTDKGLTVICASKANIKECIAALNYDIAILDFYESYGDLSLLVLLKKLDALKPVITLTEYLDANTEYNALKAGAAMCYYRPYNIGCLYLLTISHARSAQANNAPIITVSEETGTFAGVTLDDNLGVMLYGEEVIAVKPIELACLKYMFNHRDQHVDKQALVQAIYGELNQVVIRRLDVHICSLRKKLALTPIELSLIRGRSSTNYLMLRRRQ